MKLLVSILNFRTPDLSLRAARASLEALSSRANDWHMVLVDNDSGDGSEAQLHAAVAEHLAKGDPGWEHVTVLQAGRNGGFGAGNNVAIRWGRDQFPDLKYVYVQNSDAFPAPDAIDRLIDFLDQNEHYAFAGSYIHGTEGEPHQTQFRFPSVLGEFEGAIRFGPVSKLLKKYQMPLPVLSESRDVDWLAGASFLARMSALDTVGEFDETFFLYFEETDLCLRAKRAGWLTRFIRESEVAHIGGASTGMKKWQRVPRYWLDSRRYYFIKNHGRMTFVLATVLRGLGSALFGLRCFLTRKDNPEPQRFVSDMFVHALRGSRAPEKKASS